MNFPLGSLLALDQVVGQVLDQALARSLSAERLATKPFTPLPVLGVPGWWPANTQPGFYADTGVFRPPRPPLAVCQSTGSGQTS